MVSGAGIDGPLSGEITLADFVVFVDFLRCLDEFETATRMLSAGGKDRGGKGGLSPHDFRRAADAAMIEYTKKRSSRKSLSGNGSAVGLRGKVGDKGGSEGSGAAAHHSSGLSRQVFEINPVVSPST